MFALLRWGFVLLVLLAVVGLFRGWFSFSSPSRDADTNRINISVSVDANKLESDVEKAREKIAQRVAQRVNQLDQQATVPVAK